MEHMSCYFIIQEADPESCSVVFSVRLSNSFRISRKRKKISSENSDSYWPGLAEWIIDGTYTLLWYSFDDGLVFFLGFSIRTPRHKMEFHSIVRNFISHQTKFQISLKIDA